MSSGASRPQRQSVTIVRRVREDECGLQRRFAKGWTQRDETRTRARRGDERERFGRMLARFVIATFGGRHGPVAADHGGQFDRAAATDRATDTADVLGGVTALD